MCDEAKRHKAAEMESWAAACGNPNDYPNEMPPNPGGPAGAVLGANWQVAEQMRRQQQPRHPLEVSLEAAFDHHRLMRQSLRTILQRHGIPSNPGWGDDEIVKAFESKLAQLDQRVHVAEESAARVAEERDALQNRLLQRDPLESGGLGGFTFSLRDDCGGPMPAEGEMTDRQAIAALREEHIAFRERILKEMDETRHSAASLVHVQRLEAGMADLRLERNRQHRADQEIDDLKGWRKAIERQLVDLCQKGAKAIGDLEHLTGIVYGDRGKVDLRLSVLAQDQEKNREGVSQLSQMVMTSETNIAALEVIYEQISGKLGELCFQVDRVEAMQNRPAEAPLVRVEGIKPLQQEIERIDKQLAEMIGTVTADAGFVHEHQRRLASLEELHTEHTIRIQGLEQKVNDDREQKIASIRAVNERVNTIDHALGNLGGLVQPAFEMRHVHEGCAPPVMNFASTEETDGLRADLNDVAQRVTSIEGQIIGTGLRQIPVGAMTR